MSQSKNSLLLITVLILIWGASWPIYKQSVPYIPPLYFAGIRALGGGLLLSALLWKIRHELHFKKNWLLYVVSAILNTALFIGLQTKGLNYLPGGMFSVLVYLQPVLVGVLSWLFLKEKMTPIKFFSLIIGFTGVAIVSISNLEQSFNWVGISLALATAFFWAAGVIVIKGFAGDANPYWIVSMQLLIGGSLLLGASFMTETITNVEWNLPVIIGISFGVTVGLPLSYLIYYKLIREGEASKVATSTFLVPIIAVLISVLFLGESLNITMSFGIILVAISVFSVNRT
ncbi:DMT family transporter [Solibacillus sp. FSL H8-0538]|uniref:DMT family transporter n=1 Tax=Solibacillus sp. FSL H8-0538 TaxID=2921400 RepID=UPI0030FB5C7D